MMWVISVVAALFAIYIARMWIRAAQRADELLDEGDVDGATVWRRIFEAIDGATVR